MLESQKFTLRISEIRQRLNELSGKKEKLTDAESSEIGKLQTEFADTCLLYTSPSPRDRQKSRMPSSA